MAGNPVVHNSAHLGFDNAQAYDAHRPSYPAEAVHKLLEQLELVGKGGSKIVDLAAGTGKFTELLAARPEQYEIVAVEPLESMRSTLAAKGLQGVDVRTGTATEMSLEDGWADAVIVAQAFHWFAQKEALQEIHRVLKPGGKLGIIYNVDDYNKPRTWKASTQWEQKLHELVLDAATDGQPRFRDQVWKDVFDHQSLFSVPIEQDQTRWAIRLSLETMWDRLHTLSHVAILGAEDKKEFRAKVEQIAKGGDGDWNDRGEIELHGLTVFYWTQRI